MTWGDTFGDDRGLFIPKVAVKDRNSLTRGSSDLAKPDRGDDDEDNLGDWGGSNKLLGAGAD